MKTYKWTPVTGGGKITQAIARNEGFLVTLPRWAAKLIPRGSVGLTPETLALIGALVALATFAALCAFAMTKGYNITRKTPDGEKWEFRPGKK